MRHSGTSANLPVLVGPGPERRGARGTARASAAWAAQMLGQGGARRGLRGGPAVLDAARTAYRDAEWSGAADRRRPAGSTLKTSA